MRRTSFARVESAESVVFRAGRFRRAGSVPILCEPLDQLSTILLDILLPILLMVGLGAVLRWKFEMDLGTLSKLNIYLFTPAFIFDKVAHSKLAWADMGGIVMLTVTQVATLGLLIWGIGRAMKVSRKTLSAVALAVMFYNSGNYGLPLAELAYPTNNSGASNQRQEPQARGASEEKTNAATGSSASLRPAAKDGGAVQAFVVLSQNVLLFTVGLTVAAGASAGDFKEVLGKLFKLPVLYTLAVALSARYWLGGDASRHLPVFIEKSCSYLSAGLVPIALVTLGVQLAGNPRWPRWKPVSAVLFLRLIAGPIQMAALLLLFQWTGWGPLQLYPWPAELLILTASVPTAINTLLLTIELDGDADLAADCVFWTTMASCVSIFAWLVVIKTLWFV